MLSRKIYDSLTWIWHKFFHVPIRLKPAFDSKTPHPVLTVVFLHGISATSETWRGTLRSFQSNPKFKSVRLIALDLLGFGKSLKASWLDYDYLDYETALDAALKHLKIQTPIILVGHSMGSLIAADYLANFDPTVDIRKLILVSPPVLMAEELAKLPDKVYAKSYGSLHKIAEDVPAAEVLANVVQRFSSFRSAYIKTPAFAKSMEQIILNQKNYQTFTKLRLPTVIIHGHFDPLVMASNLKRLEKRNPHYIQYISVIGHHDISVNKRTKIQQEIEKTLQEESK